MRKRATLSCLLAAAVAASGCGGGSSSSGTRSVASTPTAPATTVSTPTGATSAPSSPGAANSAGLDGVPAYQPSRTVKRSSQSLILRSPDSVAKVQSFYSSALAGGGWVTVAKEALSSGEILTARRGTVVASVLVGPQGSGASISIAAYSSG